MYSFSDIKDILDLFHKTANLEDQEKILMLREFICELRDENLSLKEENQEFRKSIDVKQNLVTRGDVYYLNKNGKEDGPFCQYCSDAHDKLIRLRKVTDPDINADWYCGSCKDYF